jgi:hypothetical protein
MHAAPEAGPGGRARSWWAGRVLLISVIAVAVLAAAAAGTWAARQAGHKPAAAGPQQAVPEGSFTLPGGSQATLASLRGHPAMVWFVAAGCQSCQVSIPVVAEHLAAFTRSGTRILVLGLYGAFDEGATGAGQLASFGKAAAAQASTSPVWTWGLASEQLTAALDPSGTPDAYFLLDAAGHVTYQNSAPVSTIIDLLAHLPGHAAAGG